MKEVSFSKFRNSDYARLFAFLLILLKKLPVEIAAAISMDTHCDEVSEHEVDFGYAVDKNMKNPYTKLVDEADAKRDDAWNAFKFFILHCSFLTVVEVRAAAKLMIENIKVFGWGLQSKSYAVQTKLTNSFIAEVESRPELQEAIATCTSDNFYDAVKSTQSEFSEARDKFIKGSTSKKGVDPTAEKDWFADKVNEIIDDLNFHIRKKTDPAAQEMLSELQTMVETIYTEIKSRQTAAETARQEAEKKAAEEAAAKANESEA